MDSSHITNGSDVVPTLCMFRYCPLIAVGSHVMLYNPLSVVWITPTLFEPPAHIGGGGDVDD
jgi:hypothetical protein